MNRSHALIAGVTATLGAILAAILYLAANRWFGAGDLSSMVIWSLPLGVLVGLAVRLVAARFTRAGRLWRFAALVAIGGGIGLVWTIAAGLILGAWIGAFSFPVLFCWFAGGLLGGVVGAWASDLRAWPVAAALVIGILVALIQLNAYALAPEPRVRVVLRAGATATEVARAWTEVVGRPTPQGHHDLLPGITSVSADGYVGDSPVLLVSFSKHLSEEERQRLMAGFQRSPLVARVQAVAGTESAGIRPAVSY